MDAKAILLILVIAVCLSEDREAYTIGPTQKHNLMQQNIDKNQYEYKRLIQSRDGRCAEWHD